MARRKVRAPKTIPPVASAPMPEAVVPKAQLAPLYGGAGQMNRAIANAQDLAGDVYPGLDPSLAAMFPQPQFDKYGRPIGVQSFEMLPDYPAGYMQAGMADTPGAGDMLVNPDYMGSELLQAGVEPGITDALLDDGSGLRGTRNQPIGGEVGGLTPSQVDTILAQVRRRGDVAGGMASPSSSTVGMLTGMSPDDVAINDFASPGASWNDLLNAQMDSAESIGQMPGGMEQDINAMTGMPAGVSVKALLALRNLPPAVRKFLGPRMGMLPSLAGGAIGAGAAMSGDRDRPAMTTDATMRAPQMY